MFTDLPITDGERSATAGRLRELIAGRTTDLAPELMHIEPRIYWDPDIAHTERRLIFGRVPIVVAHGSELAEPNDFVVAQLPNSEALVVRQADGGVRAFLNVCRHRGARLVTEDRGSHRRFSCGYHAWSYDPDGSLRTVADRSTFGDVDTSCLGLVELPAEERHGCVWVVDEPEGTIDVADWLGPMDEVLLRYGLDRYTCYRMGSFDEPINWKLLMDAFVDNYHLAATHPMSVAPHFHNNTQMFRELGRHAEAISARKSIDRMGSGSADVAGLDRHVTIGHFVMPNTSFLRQPDHFELLTFMPHPSDPQRSTMGMRILTPSRAVSEDERRRWEKNWEILMMVLRDEDLVMNRHLQRAVRNRDIPALVLGKNEMGNQLFHRWRREMLAE